MELDDEGTIMIGENQGYRRIEYHGVWVGIHDVHLGKDGKSCMGFVAFDTPEAREVTTEQAPKWQVESWDPLTLSPSLLCRSCGNHGFIRNGKWESC
jgi:hypothetical protein